MLTDGEQIGDLYVRFRKQVGAGAASQLVLEYAVTDWLRLQSSITERNDAVRPMLRRIDGSGVDAVVTLEFGGREDDPAVPAEDPDAEHVRPAEKKSGAIVRWFKSRR